MILFTINQTVGKAMIYNCYLSL